MYARTHCALIYSLFRPGFDVPIVHPSLPETRDRTRQDVAFNLTQCRTPFRFALPKAGYYISAQDNRMTGPQSSRYAYPDNRRDLNSRQDAAGQRHRTEERRVGTGWVSICKSRGARYVKKNNLVYKN